jgi:hypothetical protein
MPRCLLFIVLCILLHQSATAQNKPQPRVIKTNLSDTSENEEDPFEGKSFFYFGVNYSSDWVWLGRHDSAALPYFTSYAGYQHKSGLYAQASFSFTTTGDRIDMYTLEAGYDHTFWDKINFSTYLYKYYFDERSTNIQVASKALLEIYTQYANDWVEPTILVVGYLNSRPDDAIGLKLDHVFSVFHKSLDIVPSVTVYSGTQHFYNDYLVRRLKMYDKSITVDNVLEDESKFKVIDYEISATITYALGKWLFTFIPTYTIPLSPSQITFPNRTFTETLSNLFYVELDICHR